MLNQHAIGRRTLTLLASLAVAGCGTSTGPDGEVTVTGVSVTATPNPADVTATVQASAQVSPSEAPQSVAWTSSNEDIATVDSNGLVTLLLTGTVTITATSTIDDTHSGSVTLNIVCPEPRRVTAPINDDTTWENWVPDPACFDYVVEQLPQFNGQLLTIEPGTVVGFAEDVGLRVRINAGLNAEGTADEPIRLTGLTEERGSWEGVTLDGTTHPSNVIAHTVIEYAEGRVSGGHGGANLWLLGETTVRIENSTFRQSASFGLSLDSQAEITGAGGNSLTENALGPAWTMASAVPYLSQFTLTGNDSDVVIVRPLGLDEDAVWPPAVYRVLFHTSNAFTVIAGNLTLSPGTQIRFEGGQTMRITSDATITAVGTATDPILLTGTEAVPGHWGGLAIGNTAGAVSRLDHVIIEYGGGLPLSANTILANLTFPQGANARATITNTTLRGSAEYGMYVTVGSTLDGFENNTLTGNVLGPAFLDAPAVDDMLTSNDFSGNGIEEIAVAAGATNALDDPATWRDLGVPYNVRPKSGRHLVVNGAWTIEPGVEILFDPDLGVEIRGSLTAEGTSDNRISLMPGTAPWQGISFLNSTGSLDYIDITEAGSLAWGQAGAAGAVTIIATSAQQSSVVEIGSGISITDSGFAIVFSGGPSIATGCPGPIYIPPLDDVSDHCQPPT